MDRNICMALCGIVYMYVDTPMLLPKWADLPARDGNVKKVQLRPKSPHCSNMQVPELVVADISQEAL